LFDFPAFDDVQTKMKKHIEKKQKYEISRLGWGGVNGASKVVGFNV
jgi:hypothetical protein